MRKPDRTYSARLTTVKRKPKRAAFGIRDKVSTLRGEGVIKCVFPRGPHGRNFYAVNFGDKRIGVIFREDEMTLVERSHEST